MLQKVFILFVHILYYNGGSNTRKISKQTIFHPFLLSSPRPPYNLPPPYDYGIDVK